MEQEKQSVWNRNLNLVFVYLIVFLFGLAIVGIMTNFLDSKVEEFNSESYTNQNM